MVSLQLVQYEPNLIHKLHNLLKIFFRYQLSTYLHFGLLKCK